jgi:hypothetical protein
MAQIALNPGESGATPDGPEVPQMEGLGKPILDAGTLYVVSYQLYWIPLTLHTVVEGLYWVTEPRIRSPLTNGWAEPDPGSSLGLLWAIYNHI